jgi:[ribosomal protein S18]-alanine N-acetyltransferase
MPASGAKMKAQSLRLRTFHFDDFETIYDIDQACYSRDIAYSRRELRWYLNLPGAEAILAEFDGKVIAFILTAHWDHTGHVVTIDVLPEFRRKHIGTILLREAEARFVRRRVASVELETATNNSAGIAFWKRHGYLPHGILKNYYPDGLDAHAMIKSLKPPENGA